MKPRHHGWMMCAVMLGALGSAYLLTPRQHVAAHSVELDAMVPRQFGDWTEQASSVVQVAPDIEQSTDTSAARPAYDQVMMRTYRRGSDGAKIMLALAYSRQQKQEFKIHRPDLCYYGQGFEVQLTNAHSIQLESSRQIDTESLLARNRARLEPVTYWIRIGNQISSNPWLTRWIILEEGFAGRVPDGILVRASSLIDNNSDAEDALLLQRNFLSQLYRSLSPHARTVLAGI